MSDWSNEPWGYEQDSSWTALRDHNRKRLGWTDGLNQEANAQRIVACVNALAGFHEPEADVQALVDNLGRVCNELESVLISEFQTTKNSRPDMTNSALQNAKNLLGRLRREP